MIDARPYSDAAALCVFRALDPHDLIEAELARGAVLPPLALFADWRMVQAGSHLSRVLHFQGQPFAVLVLAPGGPGGVAQAAFLARSHRRWRRPLVAAARDIRSGMRAFCEARGLHRIEARCHALHPSAGSFLTACGFHHETDLPGFGGDGQEVFRQFAWISSSKEENS